MGRRILVYGMPSSGASYVAWCLSSNPNEIVLPDLYGSIAPDASHFDGLDVILKVCVGKRGTLEDCVRAFRPDRTILVLRDEAAVRDSLMRRWASARRPRAFLNCGPRDVSRLLRIMRHAIAARDLWDEALIYGNFADQQIVPERDLWDIVETNWRLCEWCRDNHRPQKWGIGGIKQPGMTRRELDSIRRGVRCLNWQERVLS